MFFRGFGLFLEIFLEIIQLYWVLKWENILTLPLSAPLTNMNYRVQAFHHPFGFIDILWYISPQCSGLISEWFSDITVASWYVSDVSITKVDIEGIVVSKVVMMEHGGVVDLFITFRMILWHYGGFLICLGCLHHQGGQRGHRPQQGLHDWAWERGGVVLVAEATADNTRPAQE